MNDAWFYRLKAAQQDLINLSGGIVRAAARANVSKSQVGRWNDAGSRDLMSLEAVLTLEAQCGAALVTSVMAELNGRRLSDPEADGEGTVGVVSRHADAVRAAGELMAAGAAAFADGRITPAEARAMDRAAATLDRANAELRKALAGARGGSDEDVSIRLVESERGGAA